MHLEILQSDWLRGFWPISQEQDFSQRICAGTQQIKNFEDKVLFWAIFCPFPQLLVPKMFFHEIQLLCTIS